VALWRFVRHCVDAAGKAAAALLLAVALLLPASTLPAQADNAQYFYDPGGRLIGMIDPVNGSATYNYDQAGNITSIARTPSTTMGVVQFFPTRGPVGTSVTISGTAFTGGTTTVKFGTITATPTSVTANTIVVPVPSGVSGAVAINISRTSPAGSVTTPTSFTVASPLAAPTITSFTPTTQVQGSSVTVSGSGFDPILSKAYVNGQVAQVTAATTSSLTFLVPLSSSGKVSISTPVGSATSNSDLIVPPPTFAATALFSAVRTTLGAPPVTTTTGATGTFSLTMFDVTAGKTISVFINQADVSGNPKVSLLAPNGTAIYPSTAQGSSNLWYGPVNLSDAGTYSLVEAPTSGTSGRLTTVVYDVPAPVVQTLTVGGATGAVAVATPGQQGVFLFNATAGQSAMLWMSFAQSIGCNTYSILNPDGTYLQTPLRTCSGAFFHDSGAPFSFPQTGQYKLSVTQELATNKGSAGRAFLLARVFSVPGSATGAPTIGGNEVALKLTTPGQKGRLTFSGTTGQKISIFSGFSQMTTGVKYSVTNPDGSILVPTGASDSNLYLTDAPIVLPQTGTYQIDYVPTISSRQTDGTGFILTRLYNIPADATTSLAVTGDPKSLAFTAPGQSGSVTFSETAGHAVSIWVTPIHLTSCVGVTLKNPDGSVLIPKQTFCSTAYLTDAQIPLSQTGTYTVVLEPDLTDSMISGTGKVLLAVYDVPADVTSTVAFGTVTPFQIGTPGQQGVQTFPGTTGQKVTINLNAYEITSCDKSSLLNPDASILVAAVNNCDRRYLSGAPITLPQTGIYSLTHVPDINSVKISGTGQILDAVFSVPPDASAALTVGGPTLSAYVSTPGQRAAFTFTGTSGQKVILQMDFRRMSTCNTFSVLNPDGTTLVTATATCNASFTSATLTLGQTGVYQFIDTPQLQSGDAASWFSAGTGWVDASVVSVP